MENHKKHEKHVILHLYELFQAQTVPTKLLIIGLLITALTVPVVLMPVFVKADIHGLILSPTDDGHVNRSDTKDTYGTDDEIKSDKDRTAYLKFNLASLAGQPVARAELRMYVAEDSKIAHTIKNVPNTSWQEKTLSYRNRPEVSGPVIATVGPAKKGQIVSVDVTNDVISHIGQLWSIAIESPTNQSDSLYFYSKDNKSRRPELVIELSGGPVPTGIPPQVSVMPTTARPTSMPSVGPSGVVSPTRIATVTRVPTATRVPTSVVPTSIVMNTPTTAPGGGSAQYPAQVLDLRMWKETLPIGPSEDPTEIKQPALATYRLDPWFIVNPGGGVRFRAPVTGTTTGGSSYPRSELREMGDTVGKVNASWSSGSGVHTMYIDQAITAKPKVKDEVVAGQIHDGGDDVIVIRLDNKRLFVNTDGPDMTLTENYNLGDRFQIKFEVSGNQTRVYYNNSTTPAFTYDRSYSGAYFKAGAYTQANCTSTKEYVINGQKVRLTEECRDDNYGEVVIYGLQVTHR